MIKKIFFLLNVLIKYKKKIFKVSFFEISYSIIMGRTYYKIYNDALQADSLPCPYYFIYKISKFIKKTQIKDVIDLGSGNGRVVNFLSTKTNARIKGFEKDKEIYNYSIKNLNKNAKIELKDISFINYSNLNVDCYILNTPFWQELVLKNLIDKIFSSNMSRTKKYYIIIINTDVILKTISLEKLFENFKLIKFVNAGPVRSLRIYESK